jgi:thiol-disulfide isomerase/thioredoxin
MTSMRKSLLAIIAIVLAIAIFYYKIGRHSPVSSRPSSRVTAGSHAAAPAFSLQDLEGKPLTLENYRGKVVVLDFWATWCAPCRTEIPHFVKLQEQYGGQGLQIIGISMDDTAKPVREFYREFKMNYPVGVGNEQVAEAYGGVLGLPVIFLIGRDGRIAEKYVGEVQAATLEQGIQSLLQK